MSGIGRTLPRWVPKGILPGRSEVAGMVARVTADLTVAALPAEGAERLRASVAGSGPEASPELDAQLLLAHTLAVPRTRLKSHPEELPQPTAIQHYRSLLAR